MQQKSVNTYICLEPIRVYKGMATESLKCEPGIEGNAIKTHLKPITETCMSPYYAIVIIMEQLSF